MTKGFSIGIGDGEMSLYDENGRLRLTPDSDAARRDIFSLWQDPQPVEILRIRDGKLTVNPDLPADEVSRRMLETFNAQVEALVLAEREACAEIARKAIPKYERFEDQRAAGNTARKIEADIRARGTP